MDVLKYVCQALIQFLDEKRHRMLEDSDLKVARRGGRCTVSVMLFGGFL
jgi:hypothetical protein